MYKLRVVSSVLYKQIEEFKMISIKLSKGEKSYLYYDNTKIDNSEENDLCFEVFVSVSKKELSPNLLFFGLFKDDD